MATSVDGAALDKWFKDIYQEGYTSLLPNNTKFYRMIRWNDRELTGEKITAGVVTRRSNGFTYGGTQNLTFGLKKPNPMQTKRAEVAPNQIVLREFISMATATRGASSAQAFGETVGLVVENMMESFGNRLEISLVYGGVALATFNAKSTPASNQLKFTISDSEWAVGLWSGLEGSDYNFYNAVPALLGSSDPLSADAIGNLISVDTDTKQVTFQFNATGYAAVNGATLADIRPYFAGSFNNEMAGLDKICSNTGTLFNISAVDNSLWKSVLHTITGALTVGKVNQAIAKLVGKGLSEDVELVVNPSTWTDMVQDVLAQRLFDSSYESGKAVLGHKTLEFVSQNGRIAVIPHNMIKSGIAYMGPVSKRLERVGSSDITMRHPGRADDTIFLNLIDEHGFELRAFSDQSLFTKKPGLFSKITGIVNGA